jgi:hypothetical protein
MLLAFLSTGKTYVGTDPADFFGVLTIHTHHLGGRITDRGAFHVELNAAAHHFYIFFLQTRRSAMIANGGAAQTGLDTALVHLVMGHV